MVRLLPSEADEETGEGAGEGPPPEPPPRHARPMSSVEWAKRNLPGHAAPTEPPRAPPSREGQPQGGQGPPGVDPWGTPKEGRWRLCLACGHDRSLGFALVSSASKCVSQPPLAAPKLMAALLGVWSRPISWLCARL